MAATSAEFKSLLLRARQGDENALGELLHMYRAELRTAAAHEIGARLRVRTDESDVAQRTMLSAIRKFQTFTGEDQAAFFAWLQKIQARNLQDDIRQHVHAERRSIKREVAIDDSSFSPNGFADVDGPSPEQHVLDEEKYAKLRAAIGKLPEEQQVAVRLRHLEQWQLDEIAEATGKTKTAVASLITRGLRALRGKLSPEDFPDGQF